MDTFRKAVEALLQKHKLDPSLLEIPPDQSMGDFAYPCFSLAKELKKAPALIAKDLVAKCTPSGVIAKIEAKGPYLNFFLDKTKIAENILQTIFKEKENYGKQHKKTKIMVEYSQPNTHKEFHIGHLRNVSLGTSLIYILRHLGYEVIAANYLGDIGTHVAKSLWYLKKYKPKQEKTESKGRFLGRIYTEANKKLEEDPTLKEEVDLIHQKLEAKEKEWYDLWKETRQWSLDEFKSIYKYLDAPFDVDFYESEVEEEGKKIAKLLLDKGVAIKDQGAVLVDLEQYKLGKCLILKKDGTSLYSTKDLSLAVRKFEDFHIERSIHIVDARQKFYFQQLFKVLELAGFTKQMYHLSYEFVTLPEGAMASRKGNVVLFTEMRDEIYANLLEETRKRHEDWKEKKIEQTAKAITLATLKFEMLRHENNAVIIFDKEKAMSIEGETGPYCQYAHARSCSILKKYTGKISQKISFAQLKEPQEYKLVHLLAQFPKVLLEVDMHYKPSLLVRYTLELAQAFNEFYHAHQVISEDESLTKARLFLVFCVKEVLANALHLLGI